MIAPLNPSGDSSPGPAGADGVPNTAEILSGAAGTQGLLWALNSPASLQMLHSALESMLEPSAYSFITNESGTAGSLRLTRAKFKPGRKLTAFYSFSTDDTSITGGPDGREKKDHLLAVTWGEPGKSASSPEKLEEMQREAGQRGLLHPFRTLWKDIPEWGIHLQAWPLDPHFPQLVRLGDTTYMRNVLRTTGIAQSAGLSVAPIRYRPGERHVLRYTLDPTNSLTASSTGYAGDGQPQYLYAKLYGTPADAARAYRVANRVVDWLTANLETFQGARPAGWSEAEAAIFYPHINGLPLSGQLDRPGSWVLRQMTLIGAALRVLHSGPASLAEDLEPDTLEDELRGIRRAGEHLRVLLPETGRLVEALLDQVNDLHGRLPQEPPTFTHSDFKADHLFAAPDHLTLIDFDTCALADPALDLGKFLADLEWWFSQAGQPGVEQSQKAFLAGYAQGNDSGRLARARLYQVLILIKITLRRAPIFSPDWALITSRMIQRAEILLSAAAESSS